MDKLFYYNPASAPKPERTQYQVDTCVYGDNAAAIVAAIETVRLGHSVVVIAPSRHLGGLTTGGLSLTDVGNRAAVGGLARAFYKELGEHYGCDEEYYFEPSMAGKVLASWIEKHDLDIERGAFLESVEVVSGRIVSIRTENGISVSARCFIDTTYEGDLMARAGVPFTVGREGNAPYGETINGAYIGPKHQFDFPVDPYVIPGVPSSGLLPGIEETVAEPGVGDYRVQAYCFRMCLTQQEDNRIPFAKPENYRPEEYELLKRYLATGWDQTRNKFDQIRGNKVDKNNHGAVSTDFIGRNFAYPNGSYATRQRVFEDHVNYQKGLFWFLGNDPAVPADIREFFQSWGLCRDEFTETGGWSHNLYIREARRMLADVVMTENHVRGHEIVDDGVALAAYTMDSHNCRRFVVDGKVRNEGDVQIGGFAPYPISYRALRAPSGTVDNLFVSSALGASHIAYGSIRMEPVFMELAQSAAIAAVMTLEEDVPADALETAALQAKLTERGQVLVPPPAVKDVQRGV